MASPGAPLTTFLVERYLSATGARNLDDLVRRLALICSDLTGDGPTVQYLQSIHLPEEDTCFCVFAASSELAVLAVNSAANFPLDRITAGVAMLPTTQGDPR